MAVANCGGLRIDGTTLAVDSATKNLTVKGVSDVDSQNIVYISSVETVNPDGSILNPFNDLSDVITYITAEELTNVTIIFFGGVYTHTGDVTFPNIPITIEGNQSILTVDGDIIINSPKYIRRDLFTVADNVIFNNFEVGARCIINGGSITGNVEVNSYVETIEVQLNNGVITVGDTGQLVVSLCSPTSKFVSTGMLTLDKINMNTGYAGYLVTSTAGQLLVNNSLITNLNTGIGGAISCDNGATTTPNIIGNNFIITLGTGYGLTSGNASVIYGKNFVSGTNKISATGLIPVSTDITGAGNIMSLGSDATGDLYYRSSTGVLTRLGVGTVGQVLTSNGTLPYWA